VSTATKISSGLLALAVAGCSTAVGPLSPPPSPGNAKNSANVRVYRVTRPADDLLRMVFTINGNGTYALGPGERYDFRLAPGSYQFGYQMGPENCAQYVQIRRGGNYVFALGSGCNIVLESQ
jgi:hypothetical protein